MNEEGQIITKQIVTSRLVLISATSEILQAEIESRQQFSKLLNAAIPENWPPPLNDVDSMNWFRKYLEENPNVIGWTMWYFLLRDESTKENIAIGNGGFKSKPNSEGIVEIGYSIVEAFQGKGYCTEAVQGLVNWAFNHSEVTRIIAETFPGVHGSIRVLKKCGFTVVGSGSEEGTIKYERKKD